MIISQTRNKLFGELAEYVTQYILTLPCFSEIEQVPCGHGLYFIVDNNTVVYIGSTLDYRKRLNKRHNLIGLLGRDGVRIHYLVYDGSNSMFMRIDEAAFIAILTPIYNRSIRCSVRHHA